MSWHLGTLVAYDCESTGVDIETARIVTACIAVIDGSGKNAPSVRTLLINPGVDIPAEATKIHGISTEQARRDGGDPREAIARIVGTLDETLKRGYPVVGHNVGTYDLSLLDREARRHGIRPLENVRPVIDTLCLDKAVDRYRKGSRRLTDACEHYDVRIDGAHDASHDALASARVAWRIAQRYPQIARLSLDELHEMQIEAKRGQDASFARYLRSKGELDKADTITGDWPVIPFQRQEAMR